MAKKNMNGTLIAAAAVILTIILATVIWIWGAATIAKDVEANTARGPVVRANELAIADIKKDIAQILKTQEKMEEARKDDTKAIIEAIGRVSDGN
jgi:hypothetical protein